MRGRLWRASNPNLSDDERQALVSRLMDARRGVRSADPEQRAEARRNVDDAKRALGERGPVWWNDGAADYNRHLARNTPYAAWFKGLDADDTRF